MNAAAVANTGRQRAASQSTSGNNRAAGRRVAQGPGDITRANALTAARVTSATEPSISSRAGGRSRTAAANSINSGATVMMPRASDANQAPHTLGNATVESWNCHIATVAPTAATPEPITAAARNPT